MRPLETPHERTYREAIEEAIRQLDSGPLNLDSDSGEMVAWAILTHVLEEVDLMPDQRPVRRPKAGNAGLPALDELTA